MINEVLKLKFLDVRVILTILCRRSVKLKQNFNFSWFHFFPTGELVETRNFLFSERETGIVM